MTSSWPTYRLRRLLVSARMPCALPAIAVQDQMGPRKWPTKAATSPQWLHMRWRSCDARWCGCVLTAKFYCAQLCCLPRQLEVEDEHPGLFDRPSGTRPLSIVNADIRSIASSCRCVDQCCSVGFSWRPPFGQRCV